MGNFELNAFMPLIADRLLESLTMLNQAVRALQEKCIDLLEADFAEFAGNIWNMR